MGAEERSDREEIIRLREWRHRTDKTMTALEYRLQMNEKMTGDHDGRIDRLERVRDEAVGAAREGASIWGKVVALSAIAGVMIQVVVSLLLGLHGGH